MRVRRPDVRLVSEDQGRDICIGGVPGLFAGRLQERGEAAVIEIRDAHFPGRSPLDAYGNGGFRFAGMSHQGSLLCLPTGIYGWAPKTHADLTLPAFQRVLDESDEIEVLLIGTGPEIRSIPADLKAAFREAGLISDSMSTGAAVRTFNVMLAEDRAVAGAFLAVDTNR